MKKQKGITLVALIVTIVVLMILAAVAIASIRNDEIIAHAKNAITKYDEGQENEKEKLNGYFDLLHGNTPIVDKDGNDIRGEFATENTEVWDANENKIVIPAGFKIRVDETTNYADTVTEGIVIEDANGNQFVWIPVGEIKTEKGTITITLGRYTFSSEATTDEETGETIPAGTPTLHQPTEENLYTENVGISINSNDYTEFDSATETVNDNARNIQDFYLSATQNKGYYLGRYEAGVTGYDDSKTLKENTQQEEEWTGYVAEGEELKVVCKANERAWNYTTQSKASSISKDMYADGFGTGTFSSDLVNSYAWDTAIVFIQTFGLNASNYSNLNNSTNSLVTGGNKDEYCNINDMSGNIAEWNTETKSIKGYFDAPCVVRGGWYASFTTGSRNSATKNSAYVNYGFRPIIYLALDSE